MFEAAPEKLPLKQRIFAELESLTAPDTILASNTSAIPSTGSAAKLKHRERVVGTHFWNPPHLVPLVEVIAERKDQRRRPCARPSHCCATPAATRCTCRRDIPGFVGNRLQHALKREAIALVAAGVCDAETIDEVVKSGFGARMAVLGPLEQSDLVGLDLTLDISNMLIADLDRTTGPTSVPEGQGRGRQARHEDRRGLPQLDAGAGRRGARAAAAFPGRAGQGEARKRLRLGKFACQAPSRGHREGGDP